MQPTVHGRHGATVDYYRTVTGAGRTEVHEDPRTGTQVRITRVDHLVEVHTCCDCWRRPEVQLRLANMRSTGKVDE